MRVLHTSDWHLGRSLYGKKRYDEFGKFLSWLTDTVRDEGIDVLLIAGDIFDTSTPGNRAQALYYQFLNQMSLSGCRHVVIIAGNHDSPSFLNAPGRLLNQLGVYVIGQMTESPEDEVIVLQNGDQPEAIVCAVPYIRDRDLRTVEPGETIDEKNAKLTKGLVNHYQLVCDIAEQKRQEFSRAGYEEIPLIGMGHLFTAGGRTEDGDGVRELYVGSLAHIGVQSFPSNLDYLALGHLHVPQIVGGKEHIRYSGSPIPMGFGEAGQVKKAIKIEFKGRVPDITEINIPCFQKLIRIRGSFDEVLTQLSSLRDQNEKAWLEIELKDSKLSGTLREELESLISETNLVLSRLRQPGQSFSMMNDPSFQENLEELDIHDVFVRCLDASDVSATDRDGLIHSYHEIVTSVLEEDVHAE